VENPFTLKIYDKNFVYKGAIGNPVSVVATPRWNDPSTATIVVDLDHLHAADMLVPGARMVIEMNGVFVMSGKLTRAMGEGPNVTAALTMSLTSDFRLLQNILGWPVPSAALTAQTSEYATYTGNAETIVKNVVTANMITRLGMDVTCATNQNRGGTVADGVKLRFHPLAEKLLPVIEKAGLGIDFRQEGSGIVCEVYESVPYETVLTEESGVLQWWSWTSVDPTATRVVAGGQGDAAARVFRGAVDSTLEASHNDVIEVFKDARDSDTAGVLTSRANEALAEGVAKSGFAVRLSETDHFRYGVNGLVVGAEVTLSVGGVERTDILRECTMTFSRDQGVQIVPIVGEVSDNPDKTIAQFLSRLKKSVTDLKVSK
jgi:Siphovirus ReqiPepy6 Gp37-like protein